MIYKSLVVVLACSPVEAFNVPHRPHQTRRDAVAAAVAGSFWSLAASAYDAMPGAGAPSAVAPPSRQLNWNDLQSTTYGAPPPAMTQAMDPEAVRLERMKKKAEREKKAKEKNAEADKLIAAIKAASDAQDASAFSDQTDNLSLWIIAQGKPLPPPGGPWADILQSSPLPEGFETRLLISEVKAALNALPRVAIGCEKTRDNNGVCLTAGPLAEGSYKAMLRELKLRAPLQYDTPYGPVSF